MLVVLLVLLAAAGFAQTGKDARPLLRDIADASRNLTTYRAEGRIVQDLDVGIGGGKLDLTFHVATRSPELMRIEVAGGPEWMTGLPYTAVCNGRAGWVYYDKGKHYEKVSAAKLTEGYCTPGTLTSLEHVADDVTSAVITGTGRAQFEGRSQPCIQVHAHYRVIKDLMVPPGMVGKIGRVNRHMCIDHARKLILWDQFEADADAGPERYHILETVTYDRIERNPDLPATLFDFQSPEGATLFKDPEPPPEKAPPVAATPRALHVHALPSAISRVEPEYSQEAWDEGIQGTVIVLPEINLDGSIGM
jgi:outer membrane lipoprotein-sorting protein